MRSWVQRSGGPGSPDIPVPVSWLPAETYFCAAEHRNVRPRAFAYHLRVHVSTSAPGLWTRSFTLTVIATGLVFVGFYFLIPALPPFALMLGASKGQIGLVVGISSIAAVATRVLTGHRMDRLGKKRFLLGGLLIFSAAAACYGQNLNSEFQN